MDDTCTINGFVFSEVTTDTAKIAATLLVKAEDSVIRSIGNAKYCILLMEKDDIISGCFEITTFAHYATVKKMTVNKKDDSCIGAVLKFLKSALSYHDIWNITVFARENKYYTKHLANAGFYRQEKENQVTWSCDVLQDCVTRPEIH